MTEPRVPVSKQLRRIQARKIHAEKLAVSRHIQGLRTLPELWDYAILLYRAERAALRLRGES